MKTSSFLLPSFLCQIGPRRRDFWFQVLFIPNRDCRPLFTLNDGLLDFRGETLKPKGYEFFFDGIFTLLVWIQRSLKHILTIFHHPLALFHSVPKERRCRRTILRTFSPFPNGRAPSFIFLRRFLPLCCNPQCKFISKMLRESRVSFTQSLRQPICLLC